MSLLALLMGWIISWWLMVYWNQPLDTWLVEQVPIGHIQHTGYSSDNERQLMVQRAYDLWWMDFVIMIECESWFNPNARWDNGHAHGLCQMSDLYHKIPQEYYDSWEYQIDYCYNKWRWWTRYYWPDRIIKWVKCKDYVKSRFIFK